MKRPTITTALVAILATIELALGPGSRTSAVQVADTPAVTRSYPVYIECTSSGEQLCEPAYTLVVQTWTVLRVEFTMAETHCADISVTFALDEHVKYTSPFLGASATTGPIDFGAVFAGTHELKVQATGFEGGCNPGSLNSWAGTLVVTTNTSGPAN